MATRRSPAKPVPGTSRGGGPGGDERRAGDPATRQRVIDAAVTSILELGFYKASTNAIARQAGVTWGVLQHYFGTRQQLMLAVLRHGTEQFTESIRHASIDAPEPQARLEQLLDLLGRHYGQPAYLAYVQIRLNLDHDPGTSDEIRETMRITTEQSAGHIRRILAEAVGDDPLVTQVLFLTVRSFLMGQLLHARLNADGGVEHDLAAERHMLASLLAPYFAAHPLNR